MGFWSRLTGRDEDKGFVSPELKSGSLDALLWDNVFPGGGNSITGVHINQSTSLNATGVLACTSILAEDVAKLPWSIFRKAKDDAPQEVKDHYLYELLHKPNEWQNGLEFREQLMAWLVLRGNAPAVIMRDGRGKPIRLVPVDPDGFAVWTTPDAQIFYRVTAQDIHTTAVLRSLPTMIPAEDVLHIKGFSSNGLVGHSRIRLAREAIALALSQEQTMGRWMGNGARPSGMLTTDSKLSPDAAKRLKQDIKDNWGGLENSGKMIIGEQGLKFEKFSMSAVDMEFLQSRQFQLGEIARIFRIPMHMLGAVERMTNNTVAQLAQEYINFTLTGYTNRLKEKFSDCFDLWREGLFIEFDYSALTQADLTSRITNWRTAVMSMIATPNEARVDLGFSPKPGAADELQQPMNMAEMGSQSTGTQPDGGGRPAANASPAKHLNGNAAH